MNKLFTTLALVVLSLGQMYSQDGYVKYYGDKDYTDKSKDYPSKPVKVFKGEVMPFYKDKGNLINIVIGKDTISDTKKSNYFKLNQHTDTGYLSQKEDLIQLKKGGWIYVNATTIEPNDTITLISEGGEQLTQLVTQREVQVKQVDCGETFRLVITNAPTIFYLIDELEEDKEPEDEIIFDPVLEKDTSWNWRVYAFFAFMVIVIGFVGFEVWRFIQKRKHKNNETPVDKPLPLEWGTPIKTSDHQVNTGNDSSLSNQLLQMESNLIREIKRVSSNNNNSNEINRLKNEKTEFEDKLRALENDKRNSKAIFESDLQSANSERKQFQSEIKELKEKIINVDYLKGYSENVFAYLKFCQQVSTDAYNCFNKIDGENLKKTLAVRQLLMKFQNSINFIPIGNWIQTVQDIKDTGATTNRQLIRSFAQIQNDKDKQREFQRLLCTEVLTRYSSNLLVLAEAFKNLSRFKVAQELASETQSTFEKHVLEIVSKAKPIGLEIKYVPLFKNFEEYLGQIESVEKEKSLVYKEVSGLQKKDIAEIVSYGVKTTFEDTKTLIILA